MIGIYKITNKITGKVYIGQSCSMQTRFKAHKRVAHSKDRMDLYDKPFYSDIRKYGEENFEFEILEQIKLNDKEEYWIQKYYNEGYDMYNMQLNPATDPLAHCKCFSEEEVNKIYDLLQVPSLSCAEIAKIMNCSGSTIDNINNGKTYKRDDISYPIKQFKELGGQYNRNSLFSNEEVLEIRKRYVNEKTGSIYNDYKDRCARRTFEELLSGRTYYNNIPVYKKKEKQWYLNGKPVSTRTVMGS